MHVLAANLELPMGAVCLDGSNIVVRQSLLIAQVAHLDEVIDAVARITNEIRSALNER